MRSSSSGCSQVDLLVLIRKMGWKLVFRSAVGKIWKATPYFGLRCDLNAISEILPAKIAVEMQLIQPANFTGFQAEFVRVTGSDAIEVYFLEQLRQAGVQALYLATGSKGSPVFAQWVVNSKNQDLLHKHLPGLFPKLSHEEILLDGGYTFVAFRGKGFMSESLGQVLRMATARGARTAYTYVRTDNIRSLRGCARVGFVPFHVRVDTRHLGVRRSVVQPLSDRWNGVWDAAVNQT